MFVDDTNLFFNHKDIKHLFTVVNNKLVNIKDWFTANNLSLNVGKKTIYSFFHKPSKNNIPLSLPKRMINNYELQRKESIKFLGVLLYQHLTWKENIKLTENKIAKNRELNNVSMDSIEDLMAVNVLDYIIVNDIALSRKIKSDQMKP